MKKSKEGIKHYNETELTRRGWTKAGVRDFLGEPDWRPDFRAYGETMQLRLYKEDRVHETEKTEDWIAWREKSKKRRESARKSADKAKERKAEELENEKQELVKFLWANVSEIRDEISIYFDKKLPTLEILREKGEANWAPAAYHDPNFSETKQEHSDRVTINYLRHHCTPYDDMIYDSSPPEYIVITQKVHELISERFPELKDSCEQRVKYSTGQAVIRAVTPYESRSRYY